MRHAISFPEGAERRGGGVRSALSCRRAMFRAHHTNTLHPHRMIGTWLYISMIISPFAYPPNGYRQQFFYNSDDENENDGGGGGGWWWMMVVVVVSVPGK